MTIVTVCVKWQNQTFKDIEVDQSGTFELFSAQLFALTNVPMERQKVMLKGRILKTNQDLARIPDGGRIVLMGTSDEIAPAPTAAVLFEEDLTDSQRVTFGAVEYPCGLINMGNTCYLNSAITCLRAIPELKENLIAYGNGGDTSRFQRGSGSSSTNALVSQMGQMMQSLDTSIQAVAPVPFLITFRDQFPQFAQRTASGYSQQDADESLTQILYIFRETLKKFPNESQTSDLTGFNGLFQGQMESTIVCNELPEDQRAAITEIRTHEFTKMACHISGETNQLSDGLTSALSESIEKFCSPLERNAIFTKVDRISKLPPYLMIQFVRFFWKKDTQKKAKIMRKVIFPHRLDMVPYCTPQLQKQLTAHRDEEDRKFDEAQKVKEEEPLKFETKNTLAENASATPVEVIDPRSMTDSGMYELFALITHKGRAADAGHYIGWARGKNKGEWFQYDDHVVTKQTDDDIQKLVGGGDWHMAYICFYRATKWRFSY